jgi:hypothetical protein
MRVSLTALVALALSAFAATAASAQTPLDCSVAPESVCTDQELLALEAERAALIAQLAGLDPQSPALKNEQTWSDGLSACGEDVACYRTGYLNHNQTLRQTIAAIPGATPEPLEAPADAPTLEEKTSALDALQEERLREPREDSAEAYVAPGMPGWGFFTAIGVTLLLFWWLMRALARHRRELRAEEARLRGGWR